MRDYERVHFALGVSWSLETSSLWTPGRPARGQCGVTALVVHDALGGTILKTIIGGQAHFYNMVDGERLDFTADQFDAAPTYDDIPATREEAFADTNLAQYRALSSAFRTAYDQP